MLDYLARFAHFSDEECAQPWAWRGEARLQVRDALYRSLEDEQEAAANARPAGEAQAILMLAQGAFGNLRGLLVGLPDEVLDRVPRPDEWPLRETLRHVYMTELSYRRRTRYAAERREDEPVMMPGVLKQRPLAGGVNEVLEKLAAARAETDALLAGVRAEQMKRPTQWVEYPVDVRFRLHRFAGHIAEHTIQCEKTLNWLEIPSGESRLITRQISAMRGRHEHLSDPATLARLDASHRNAVPISLPDQRPPPDQAGQPSGARQ